MASSVANSSTDLTEIISAVIGGAAGTEIIRWLLTYKREDRKEKQAEMSAEQARADVLYEQANKIREEMRRDIDELRKQVAHLQSEVDSWRKSSYDHYTKAIAAKQQYDIVTAYIEAIMVWLKSNNIDVPIQVPTFSDIPPVEIHVEMHKEEAQ
jgi:hypothetical protein